MRDERRTDAAAAIRQMGAPRIRTAMLTGDNHRTAAAIAGSPGLEHHAALMPQGSRRSSAKPASGAKSC